MARGDYYASPFGVTYSAYMERPRLSRAVAVAALGPGGRVEDGADDVAEIERRPAPDSRAAAATVADVSTLADSQVSRPFGCRVPAR